MDTQVVSVANRIPDRAREPYYRYETFQESLRRQGTAPTMLGLHEAWGGLMTKPRRLRQWLRGGGCTGEILIVCDAFDIVFLAPLDEIAKRYLKEWPERPVVFNAERGLFPRPELEHRFPPTGTPWRYLNSGFFIGPKEQILGMLEAMWLDDIYDDHDPPSALHGAGKINPNDQGWYQLMFAAQVVPMELDSRGMLCQSVSGCELADFDTSGEVVRNRQTGSEPLVWHFNGGAKNEIMPVMLAKWGFPD